MPLKIRISLLLLIVLGGLQWLGVSEHFPQNLASALPDKRKTHLTQEDNTNKKVRFHADKLVRDRRIEALRGRGIHVEQLTLEKTKYIEYLLRKLLEETQEVINAKTPQETLEELADVLEVIHAVADVHGWSIETVEAERVAKKQESGTFAPQGYVSYFQMPSDHKSVEYFRSKSEQYPEIEIKD